ncbi:hypothetical protein K466DRAFT_365899 [Polyporus arcularius HHB13444]|uniref:Uncharacterized protein n=1 Tax=Polyporus arcularius HHB13444 TaxID=1314778 RepID=A0A5C3PPD5_9APHY|nr:hypothetical protein K466DRAFT_365899 [Polyporus arcularius HHB13444]
MQFGLRRPVRRRPILSLLHESRISRSFGRTRVPLVADLLPGGEASPLPRALTHTCLPPAGGSPRPCKDPLLAAYSPDEGECRILDCRRLLYLHAMYTCSRERTKAVLPQGQELEEEVRRRT